MLCITVRSDGMMRIILGGTPMILILASERTNTLVSESGEGFTTLVARVGGFVHSAVRPRLFLQSLDTQTENSSSTGSMILHARATVGFLCPGIETGSAHGDDGGIRIRVEAPPSCTSPSPTNDIDMEQVPSDTYNELVRAVIGHTSLNVHDGAGSNDGIICLSREFPSRFPSYSETTTRSRTEGKEKKDENEAVRMENRASSSFLMGTI